MVSGLESTGIKTVPGSKGCTTKEDDVILSDVDDTSSSSELGADDTTTFGLGAAEQEEMVPLRRGIMSGTQFLHSWHIPSAPI